MKVFLSWSGDLSRRIATALAEWLPPVINAVDPFISSEIEKGAQWATELSGELQGSRAGIICLTPDNLESPWLNYEAGALSKSVTLEDETSAPPRVWTYLFRLRAADVRYPLAQFQHTEATREDTARLLRGINLAVARCGERDLTEPQLTKAFDRWWPVLEEVLASLPNPNSENQPPRTPLRPAEEMLAEVLELLRIQGSPSAALMDRASAKIYVEGDWVGIIQFARYVSGRVMVDDAQVRGDGDGMFVLVLFEPHVYPDHLFFERAITVGAETSKVVIREVRW